MWEYSIKLKLEHKISFRGGLLVTHFKTQLLMIKMSFPVPCKGTNLAEVNMGQKFKLCSQLNKSSTQITRSSAQLKASEFGPVIEGPTLIKLFIFSLKHSSASVKYAKKTQKLSTTEVILKFNNALHWHREDSLSYLETMAWSSTAARELYYIILTDLLFIGTISHSHMLKFFLCLMFLCIILLI